MENIIIRAVQGGWYGFIGAGQSYYEHPQLQKKYILECLKTKALHSSTMEGAVIDPLFWNALCRVCEWPNGFMEVALRFHQLNLTEGWHKAIKWLETIALIKSLPSGPPQIKEANLISNAKN